MLQGIKAWSPPQVDCVNAVASGQHNVATRSRNTSSAVFSHPAHRSSEQGSEQIPNILGGFAGDWISGLFGSALGVEEKQVIDVLTPWVVPVLVAGLAMWAAYSYGARYAGSAKVATSPPSPNATTVSADIKTFANSELMDRVHAFTKRLRIFELIENGATDVEEAKLDIVNVKVNSLGRMLKSNAEAKKAAESELARLEAKAADLEKARAHRRLSEFQAQFLQEAVQLRAELSRRTGKPVGGADDPVTDLLDKGKFEMKSLGALAGYLHGMVDRLPG